MANGVAPARKALRSSKNQPVPVPPTRDPNIEWAKNPDWTWKLVQYLSDHTVFRHKLFSDSTAAANKERRNKAVAKNGKPQQFAVLAAHIFESDSVQAEFFLSKPAHFASSVETRLHRLKSDYQAHLKTIGATGAGLAPEDVIVDSPLANLIETIIESWPWWTEFHSFWRELSNYNAVGVTTSAPGADHAGNAASLFASTGAAGGQEDQLHTSDAVSEDEDAEGEPEQDVDYAVAMDKTYQQPRDSVSRSPLPPPAAAVKASAFKPPVVPKAHHAASGRDSGLAKAQSAATTSRLATSAGHKSALKDLQAARKAEAQRQHRKREMAHELAMAATEAKKAKYELKYGAKAKEASANHEAAAAKRKDHLEELRMRLEIARYEAVARNGNTAGGSNAAPPLESSFQFNSTSALERSSSPLQFPMSDPLSFDYSSML